MSDTTADKPVKTVLILSDDLMFGSRISGEARAAGFGTRTCKTVDKMLEVAPGLSVAGAVVDLGVAGAEQLVRLLTGLRAVSGKVPMLGYGSHVDAKLLGEARAAGYDPVLPRSRFVEELGRILIDWSNNNC